MKSIKYAFSFLILSVLFACSNDDPVLPIKENKSGTYTQGIVVNEIDRNFIVYVPDAAAGTAPAPVVFMLHGTGGSGEGQLLNSGWKEKADAFGIITVFPTSLNYCYFEDDNQDGIFDQSEQEGKSKWAAGLLGRPKLPLCTQNEFDQLNDPSLSFQLTDDVAFFDKMIETLDQDYVIDTKRIYATGHSNGGSMAARLAAERSEQFAAVTLNAALLGVDPVLADRPMSMIITVGTNDAVFASAIGESIPIERREELINNPAFKGFITDQLKVHGLSEEYVYREVSSGNAIGSEFVFADNETSSDNEIRFILIEGHGHDYPKAALDFYWDFLKEFKTP